MRDTLACLCKISEVLHKDLIDRAMHGQAFIMRLCVFLMRLGLVHHTAHAVNQELHVASQRIRFCAHFMRVGANQDHAADAGAETHDILPPHQCLRIHNGHQSGPHEASCHHTVANPLFHDVAPLNTKYMANPTPTRASPTMNPAATGIPTSSLNSLPLTRSTTSLNTVPME